MLRIAKLVALVSAVVLLNAVTTLLFVQSRGPATAQVAPPCLDGDVNGDTLLDVADPVYLLTHLFGGGPSPVACAQTTPADVEAAVDAAMARYLPRAGERVFIGESVPLGTSLDLVSVPAGKVFLLEQFDSNSGTWEPNFKINVGGTRDGWQVAKRPSLTFLPGEVITLDNTSGSGNTNALIWGYWLDLAP